jgi:dTDP-4-amino-4,6-dideoxygalactose transaminase
MRLELITANRANAILYSFLTTRSKPGDHYLIPTNICPEVVLVFLKAGIKLTFLDLETENLGIDTLEIQRVLGKEKVNGILYNHTYGNEYIPEQFLEKLKNEFPQIYLLDDRCLCFPDRLYLSNLFDLVLFSTGPRKQLDIGHGGFGLFKNGEFKMQKLTRSIKDYEYVQSLINVQTEINKWKDAACLNWFESKQYDSNESYFNELSRFESLQILYK